MNRNIAAIMRMLGSSASREAADNNENQEEESQADPDTLNMSRIVRQIYLAR